MLDIMTNAPRAIRCGDRTLQVGALKLRELGLLQRWIRDHATHPADRLKQELEFAPEADHRKLRYEAMIAARQWPPQINTAAGNTVLLGDPDGQLFFLGVMLRKFQPALTDAELDAIAGSLSELDFGVLCRIGFGEDDLDPKAVREAILSEFRAIAAALDPKKDQETAAETGPGPATPTGSGSSIPAAATDPTGGDSSTRSGTTRPISPPGSSPSSPSPSSGS